MNINFSTQPGFSAYVLLLMASGVAMVLVGSPVVRFQRPLLRLLNVAFGVGFFVYGFYLAFLFQGGHYLIFVKAFIVPPVLIIRSIVSSRQRSRTSQRQVPVPQAYAAVPPAQWSAPPMQPGPWNYPQSAPPQYGAAPQWPAPPAPDAQWPSAEPPSEHRR